MTCNVDFIGANWIQPSLEVVSNAIMVSSTTTLLVLLQILRERQTRAAIRNDRMEGNKEYRRRRDRRTTGRALHHPTMSAFMTLFGSGCDQSLITATGLDH